MSHSDDSLSSDEGSTHSDYGSALAEPLSPRLDSEDDMEPLVLNHRAVANANLANPNAPAPVHPGQTLMHRLALRVQAAAAGGPQDAGGPNSPQLNLLRQQQVDQHLQQVQQAAQMQNFRQQVQHQMQQMQQLRQHAQQQMQPQEVEEVPAEGRTFGFCCKQCPARFTHLNLLTRHINEEHPVTKPFVCPDCGRGYVMRDVMEAHYLMVHRGERPFPCDQCDKVFSRREYLQTHSRVHTGFKPYLCGDCGRRFAWKGCIDIHRRTHTGERPYLCITCSRDFATLSTLKMHEMIHTNSFPFPCPLQASCGRKFRRRHDLRDHMPYHERQEADNSRAEDDVEQDEEHDEEDRAEDQVDNRTEDEVAVAVLNGL